MNHPQCDQGCLLRKSFLISCCLCFIRFLDCVFVPYLSEAVKGVRRTLGALERLRESRCTCSKSLYPSLSLSIVYYTALPLFNTSSLIPQYKCIGSHIYTVPSGILK